jgi:methyl-accepting chemotaxis protein
MGNNIAQVKEGNLGVNFNLRPKDQLQELAGSLNLMLKSIRGTITEINKEIAEVTVSGLSGKELERIENIKNLLKKFKL